MINNDEITGRILSHVLPVLHCMSSCLMVNFWSNLYRNTFYNLIFHFTGYLMDDNIFILVTIFVKRYRQFIRYVLR